MDPHERACRRAHTHTCYILPYITFDMNQKEVTSEHLFTVLSIKKRPTECEMLVLDSYLLLCIFNTCNNFLVKFG